MNTLFTSPLKKISLLLFFIVSGLILQSQSEKNRPEFLSESSNDFIDDIENRLVIYDNERTTVENIVSSAKNNKTFNRYHGFEYFNTIINLMSIPNEDKIEISTQINDDLLQNPTINLNNDESKFWGVVRNLLNLTTNLNNDEPFQLTTPTVGKVLIGKSFGDPHIETFDGNRYSFQKVGEYILTANKAGDFKIQTRQEAFGSSVSLNTAAVMNVNGDIVSIYSKNHPDEFVHNPIRINGKPLDLVNGEKKLEKGGSIKINGSIINITWPKGQEALVRLISNSSLNVVVKVYYSEDNKYYGLLGNANGNPNDDFGKNSLNITTALSYLDIVWNLGDKMEKIKAEEDYQSSLNTALGNPWRVSEQSSLFSYLPGENTHSYRDENFPKEHFNLAKVNKRTVKSTGKVCMLAGVPQNLLKECVSDIINTGDVNMAKEIALVSDNEAILEINFNSWHKLKELPKMENLIMEDKIRKENLEKSKNKYVPNKYRARTNTTNNVNSNKDTNSKKQSNSSSTIKEVVKVIKPNQDSSSNKTEKENNKEEVESKPQKKTNTSSTVKKPSVSVGTQKTVINKVGR